VALELENFMASRYIPHFHRAFSVGDHCLAKGFLRDLRSGAGNPLPVWAKRQTEDLPGAPFEREEFFGRVGIPHLDRAVYAAPVSVTAQEPFAVRAKRYAGDWTGLSTKSKQIAMAETPEIVPLEGAQVLLTWLWSLPLQQLNQTADLTISPGILRQ